MKIFHTETQADYDALMNGLEVKGIEALEKERWENNRGETVVFVHAIGPYGDNSRTDTTYGSLKWAIKHHPRVPIIKYKAKEECKMKFTKENVEAVIADWFWKDGNSALDDLVSELRKLDDTPEKVAVPKYVADVFSSELHFEYEIQESRNIPHVLSAAFSEVSSNKNIEFLQWVKRHPDKYVMVVKYGCIIEPEQLYYIPLPHLKTSDDIQQVLSKSRNGNYYFANRPSEIMKQRYTKEELEQVPEIYKPYAKPIKEEEE